MAIPALGTWEEIIRDMHIEGCCQILRLDLELRFTSARQISSRVSHFRRRADGQTTEVVAELASKEMDSLHLLYANFEQLWNGITSQGYGENDEHHNTLWQTMSPKQSQEAQSSALRLLQHQIRSQSTLALTEIMYSAVARIVLGRDSETLALQRLYRLLDEDNRAALLSSLEQARALG